MTRRLPLVALACAMLLAGCDGPHEQAGEKADAAAGIKDGPLSPGPNEKLGEIQDRAERDRKKAIEARADTAEDRADEVRTAADQRADALERQAAELRRTAKQTGKALDQQADAIRGK